MAADKKQQRRTRRADPKSSTPGVQPPKPARRRSWVIAGAAAALILGAGWFWSRSSTRTASPVAPLSTAIVLEDVGAASGIGFVLDNSTTADKPIIDSVLGGLAAFDYDNDGLADLYFTNGARLPDFDKRDARFWNRLYKNRGQSRFEDVTDRAGARGRGYSMGAAAADYDNDGRIDLYVCGYDSNTLFHNRGDGSFEDRTDSARVSGRYGSGVKPWAVAAAWLDYDRDGLLDLFVVNYLDWSFTNNRVCGDEDRRLSCAPDMYGGTTNILYRNRGDGTFEDVSAKTGLTALTGKGMSAAVSDYDHDGFLDIFIANDGMRDYLLHNINGERFEELAVETGVAFNEDGVPISSMGVAWEDVDNDSWPDLFVTALTNETFPLFLNRSGRDFVDATYSSGIGLLTYTRGGWGNAISDFDNDGWKDLFSANSHVSQNIESYRGIPYAQASTVIRNRGQGVFEQTQLALPAAAHRGSAVADLNNDGLLDVVISSIGKRPEILLNRSTGPAHWIEFELIGSRSNRQGLGAIVTVETPARVKQYRTAATSIGYASSSDARVHFGLGAAVLAKRVEIRWPSGVVQQIEDLEGDQLHRIEETK